MAMLNNQRVCHAVIKHGSLDISRPSGVARPSSPCWRRSGARVVAAPRLPGIEKEMLSKCLMIL